MDPYLIRTQLMGAVEGEYATQQHISCASCIYADQQFGMLREAVHIKKLWTFSVRGGAHPHSTAFGGVFPHYKGGFQIRLN